MDESGALKDTEDRRAQRLTSGGSNAVPDPPDLMPAASRAVVDPVPPEAYGRLMREYGREVEPALGSTVHFSLSMRGDVTPPKTRVLLPEFKRRLVIYADGVFDLFHPGHLAFLEKAKSLGGTLVVGVIKDEDAAWKRRPVMTHAERVAMVRACRHVDRVIEDPPLVVTLDFMDRNGLDAAVHGDDDKQERFFGELIEARRMVYVPYHQGVSTTELLSRVRKAA